MLHPDVERGEVGAFIQTRRFAVRCQGLIILVLHRPAVTVGNPGHAKVCVHLDGSLEIGFRGIIILDQVVVTPDGKPGTQHRRQISQ